jgi:hypothetical protein
MTPGLWKWAAWLLLIVVSFSVMEGYSLYDNTATLSRFVWTISAHFPAFPWIAGFITGFLVCHFWWMGNPFVDKGQTTTKSKGKN